MSASICAIQYGQRAARFDRRAKELAEHRLGVTLAIGMAGPDRRIRGDGKERVPVVGPERAQDKQLAQKIRQDAFAAAQKWKKGKLRAEPGAAPNSHGQRTLA